MRKLVFAFMMAALLLSSNAWVIVSHATQETQPAQPTIPPQLLAFFAEHPSSNICVTGNTNPFSISSTDCNLTNSSNTVPATSYTLYCSSGCQTGTWNTPALYNFTELEGDFTVPSNPSTDYGNGTQTFYWIGLSNCTDANTVTCGADGTSNGQFLIQAGLVWGDDGSNNSYHPALFYEYEAAYTGDTYCETNFCGGATDSHIRAGDSVFIEIEYSTVGSGSPCWLYFIDDTTSGKYLSECWPMGTGEADIPTKITSLEYPVVAFEDDEVTSSSGVPGGTATTSFTYLVGQDASSTLQIGTANLFGFSYHTSGTTIGFTTTESQYSCTIGSTMTTCQTTSVAA
jgi:hypothetical protein